LYNRVPPHNYGWYECRLHVAPGLGRHRRPRHQSVDHIGTAIVASTNVPGTGDIVRSQSQNAKLMIVSVGKTQSQIIRASWLAA
jgi:hypothetical protein